MESGSASIQLSIIIVNYNGKHLLAECLAAVRYFNDASYVEVILVDNASQDGSAEWLTENYPWVRLICSKINLGFTGGNNLGAAHARGEYLVLLNSDTVVHGPFKPLMKIMQEEPKVGVVGCQLKYENGQLQESIGYEHTPINLAISWLGLGLHSAYFRRTVHHLSRKYDEHCVSAAWVSGACLMVRSYLWKQIEGFDERYFMYVEDVDLCKRVRSAGYIVVYTNDIWVTHYEGGGKDWLGEKALINTMHSYCIYLDKFYGASGVLLMKLLLIPIFLLRAATFFCLSKIGVKKHMRDKSLAYYRAARKLVNERLA